MNIISSIFIIFVYSIFGPSQVSYPIRSYKKPCKHFDIRCLDKMENELNEAFKECPAFGLGKIEIYKVPSTKKAKDNGDNIWSSFNMERQYCVFMKNPCDRAYIRDNMKAEVIPITMYEFCLAFHGLDAYIVASIGQVRCKHRVVLFEADALMLLPMPMQISFVSAKRSLEHFKKLNDNWCAIYQAYQMIGGRYTIYIIDFVKIENNRINIDLSKIYLAYRSMIIPGRLDDMGYEIPPLSQEIRSMLENLLIPLEPKKDYRHVLLDVSHMLNQDRPNPLMEAEVVND